MVGSNLADQHIDASVSTITNTSGYPLGYNTGADMVAYMVA
jgi:hypothetical protein